MNFQRPTRATFVFSVGLIALAGTQIYEHARLSDLTNSLTDAASSTPADAVLARVGRVEERLNEADAQRFVTDDDFRAAQQALSNRIETLQAQSTQTTDALQALTQKPVLADEFLALTASVESIGAQVSDLQKARTSSSQSSAPKATTAPKPKRLTPPFTAFGIESRGGVQFLSVAPIGSTKLDQVQLIRPGELVTATMWQLISLDEKGAHFDVAGTRHTISIVP